MCFTLSHLMGQQHIEQHARNHCQHHSSNKGHFNTELHQQKMTCLSLTFPSTHSSSITPVLSSPTIYNEKHCITNAPKAGNPKLPQNYSITSYFEQTFVWNMFLSESSMSLAHTDTSHTFMPHNTWPWHVAQHSAFDIDTTSCPNDRSNHQTHHTMIGFHTTQRNT